VMLQRGQRAHLQLTSTPARLGSGKESCHPDKGTRFLSTTQTHNPTTYPLPDLLPNLAAKPLAERMLRVS